LAPALERLRAGLAPPTALAAVQQIWSDAVGRQIANEAQPTSEHGSTIVVECDSATWAAELEMMAPELLGRLNEALPEGAQVASFKFVVRPS
jgi:predicted nucleic acid-binding Zn ribbon protein